MDSAKRFDLLETIPVFRRFNRFYTRLLGLFNKRLLDGPLTLTEARALYEITAEPGTTATALSARLGLDRGQLSRVIAALIKAGLIQRSGSPGGRRALPLRPTKEGARLMAELEAMADRQAAALIGSLGPHQCARLTRALEEVRALLDKNGRPNRSEIKLREATSPDLAWIIARHAELYADECGFGDDFAHYVILGLAEYVKKDPAGSKVWIAEACGAPKGAVGVVDLGDGRAQLRWLLVEPQARGLGLGKMLVEQVVSFCRERGHSEIILWTITTLQAARGLYASFGFSPAGAKPGVMGGVPVTEEQWTLALDRD